MAYNDYMDYGVGEYETEEERRKREEREAAERAAANAPDNIDVGGGFNPATAGGGSGIADIASRYVQNRLGQAQQRVSDATQMFTDPEAALTRRMGMAPEQAANTEVQTQTVKTYADGSQEEITKKQLPAEQLTQQAPAAAPAPVAPQAQAPAQAPTQAAPMPVSPENQFSPEAQARAVQQVQQQIQQIPQPGAPVQVASTERGAGVAEAARAQQAQQAPTPVAPAPAPTTPTGQAQVAAPTPAPSVAQAGAQAQAEQDRARQAVVDAHNEKDPEKRRQAMANILATGDEASKQMARSLISEDYIKEKNYREAEKKIEEASPTELARYMKERNKEGSYVKAILFARLGLNDLAKREQQLLNPDLKMETAVVGTDKYTVVRDDFGGVVRAFDVDGKEVGQKALAKISAAAMPTKSHLLPSTHGAPVINSKGETGLIMYDPQTQTSYVQVGNERRDTKGWTTLAQSPENVYGAAGAKKQAEQAAETGQSQGALPPRTPEQAAAAQRAEGDIAGADREIARLNRLPDSDPTKQQRIAIVSRERTQAQQRLQQAGGPVGQQGGTGGVGAGGGGGAITQQPGESYSSFKRREALAQSGAEKAQAANIDLGKEERSNFLTYEEKDIIPKADAGGNISRIRKQQLKGPDGILNNPSIVGIMSGGGTQAQELASLIRDTVTGGIKDDELSRRVNALGIKDLVLRGKIQNQLALNNSLAPETLKANAGAGAVSDAEQTANRRANIDITRVPLYTAVTMLSRDQFEKDLAVSRQAFRNANPNLTTVRAFNDAWGKEKERLQGEYDRIYAARALYIAKHSPDGSNPNAITQAYNIYPVPEFSRDGGWNYGTDFARKAARKPLDSFNR